MREFNTPFLHLVDTIVAAHAPALQPDNVIPMPTPRKAEPAATAPLDRAVLAMASIAATIGEGLVSVKAAPRAVQIKALQEAHTRAVQLASCTKVLISAANLRDLVAAELGEPSDE